MRFLDAKDSILESGKLRSHYKTSLIYKVKLKLESVFYVLKFGF